MNVYHYMIQRRVLTITTDPYVRKIPICLSLLAATDVLISMNQSSRQADISPPC